MAKDFVFGKMAGSRKKNDPRLFGCVVIDNLANCSTPLFHGIRQQLASGGLPNLAQHFNALGLIVSEKPFPCLDKVTKANF